MVLSLGVLLRTCFCLSFFSYVLWRVILPWRVRRSSGVGVVFSSEKVDAFDHEIASNGHPGGHEKSSSSSRNDAPERNSRPNGAAKNHVLHEDEETTRRAGAPPTRIRVAESSSEAAKDERLHAWDATIRGSDLFEEELLAAVRTDPRQFLLAHRRPDWCGGGENVGKSGDEIKAELALAVAGNHGLVFAFCRDYAAKHENRDEGNDFRGEEMRGNRHGPRPPPPPLPVDKFAQLEQLLPTSRLGALYAAILHQPSGAAEQYFKPFAAELLQSGSSGMVIAYFTALGLELMGETDFLLLLQHSEWKDFGDIGYTIKNADRALNQITMMRLKGDFLMDYHAIREQSFDEYEFSQHLEQDKSGAYIDAGSHVGVALITALRRNPSIASDSVIVSLEPAPQNYFHLRWNLFATGLHFRRLWVLNAGFGREPGPGAGGKDAAEKSWGSFQGRAEMLDTAWRPGDTTGTSSLWNDAPRVGGGKRRLDDAPWVGGGKRRLSSLWKDAPRVGGGKRRLDGNEGRLEEEESRGRGSIGFPRAGKTRTLAEIERPRPPSSREGAMRTWRNRVNVSKNRTLTHFKEPNVDGSGDSTLHRLKEPNVDGSGDSTFRVATAVANVESPRGRRLDRAEWKEEDLHEEDVHEEDLHEKDPDHRARSSGSTRKKSRSSDHRSRSSGTTTTTMTTVDDTVEEEDLHDQKDLSFAKKTTARSADTTSTRSRKKSPGGKESPTTVDEKILRKNFDEERDKDFYHEKELEVQEDKKARKERLAKEEQEQERQNQILRDAKLADPHWHRDFPFSVPLLPLSWMVHRFSIKQVSFFKIDCEGCETALLNWAATIPPVGGRGAGGTSIVNFLLAPRSLHTLRPLFADRTKIHIQNAPEGWEDPGYTGDIAGDRDDDLLNPYGPPQKHVAVPSSIPTGAAPSSISTTQSSKSGNSEKASSAHPFIKRICGEFHPWLSPELANGLANLRRAVRRLSPEMCREWRFWRCNAWLCATEDKLCCPKPKWACGGGAGC